MSGARAGVGRVRPRRRRAARLALLAILVVVGVNALGGAWYGVAGAEDVPREWLEDSPFDSYLVPSLYLGIAIGGSHLVAVVLVLRRSARALAAVLVASVLLATWIIAQVALIGPVSWLQPAMLAAAVAEALLAWRLALR